MPSLDIARLPDDSRIWIFGISPALDAQRAASVLERVDEFLGLWTAHGAPIASARDLLHGSFLVIAIDRRSETTGCSIDRMFDLLKALEREHGISILDPARIFHRGADGLVQAISRTEFRASGDPQTIVFDVLAERLGEVRSGRWERPAELSWHRSLLPAVPTA